MSPPPSPKLTSLMTLIISTLVIINTPTEGAKILLLPLATGSHLLTFIQIGTELSERGHELHSVLNVDCKVVGKLAKFGVINHGFKLSSGCPDDNPDIKKRANMVLKGFSFFTLRGTLRGIGQSSAERFEAMHSDQLLPELKKEKFDIAIVDAIFFSRPLYVLPYRLGIPTISVGAANSLLDTGTPALPSFTPFMRDGRYNNKMSFIERVHNTLLTLLLDKITLYFLGHNNVVAQYAPEMPYKTLDQLYSETALWLIMNDPALDYPQVHLPHVIDIGGLNTGPGKPLTGDMKKIADGATEGLVLVSFGSMISDLPDEITNRLYNDLKLLKETVIWRHTGEEPVDKPLNIHLVKWMPQNDLLAHPNTKLFVTHCGANGQFEALYSGVPMVGMPIFGDQKYNAVRMESKGMGLYMDMLDFRPGQLYAAIQEVLHNDTYSKAMKKYSAIFKSQPMTQIERAIFWIEHVIQFGYEHLRPPAVDMPWYQYWCIDVFLFLMFSAIIVLSLFTGFVWFVLKKCMAFVNSKKCDSPSSKLKKKHQ